MSDVYYTMIFKWADDLNTSFKRMGHSSLELLSESTAMRYCWTEVYRILVAQKHCPSIEELHPKEKEELWAEAVRLADGKPKKIKIEIAKALHGMGAYLQQKLNR